ncbi:MAG: peptide ABC transporter substrate-binding protein [Candidatus Velthaea sp.]|jgi:peptide/nickel transport system substrate-binding protein
MRRFAAAFLAATLLAPLGIPCAASAAAHIHVLRWSDGLDVSTLNPLLANTGNVVDLSRLTMAHFTRFDSNDTVVPELITKIPSTANGGISRDGRTITYHLRRDVKWSDGVPFDADDVTYTVGAILNRANNVSNREAWDHVAGTREIDKYTVAFHLKMPYAPFATSFFGSGSLSCVLPKHVLGSAATINETAYNALPIGIGPFRYTAFHRGEAVEMEANPYYFRGKPKLAKIIYKIIPNENTLYTQLQTGELDLWASVGGTFAERVRHIAGVRTVTAPSPYISAIFLNTTSPVTRDRNVRRALRFATNRAYLLHNVYHDVGTLAESVVPQVATDFDAGLPQAPYDPALAERILDAAGWRRGPDGTRAKDGVALVVNIAIPSDYAPSAVTAELLRASWKAIGVGVEVKPFGDALYFAPAASGGILFGGKFDAALLSQAGGVMANVAGSYGCVYAAPHGLNVTRYCNRAVDAGMRDYEASYDPKQRAELGRRFQRQIDADAPAIVTYERSFVFAFNAGLTGFAPTAFGTFDEFMAADMQP